ncbi:MAG: hypothetical protein IJL76_00440 [Bacilli bacterium]|nr:hypothetical protein [Bacilli bacterium]
MSDYEKYVTIINTIYDCTNKMRQAYDNQDNIAHLDSIDEYKNKVVELAENYSKDENNNKQEMETLGE